ncbi:MAG: hypothetical protein E7629_03490 [Ruminococcaceae bacterium]|nr:hypothetical protein [Oscillospiraceae bacterium]
MIKILSFGEIIWDVFPDGDAVIGGAPLNFAAHAVKCGAEAFLFSAIGEDALGERAIRALQNLGVKTDLIGKSALPTGRCLVTLKNGSPSYEVCRPAAYDHILLNEDAEGRIGAEQFDAFCFGTLAAREQISRHALQKTLERCKFGSIFCDINLRPNCYDEESVKLCFENANLLKISEEEEPLLSAFPFYQSVCPKGLQNGLDSLFDTYPNLALVLFTKGEKGATVYQKDGTCVEIPPCPTTVASTVGAGDSFGAAFLTSYLGGASIPEAGSLASRVSAFVVSKKEAVPEYRLPL